MVSTQIFGSKWKWQHSVGQPHFYLGRVDTTLAPFFGNRYHLE